MTYRPFTEGDRRYLDDGLAPLREQRERSARIHAVLWCVALVGALALAVSALV